MLRVANSKMKSQSAATRQRVEFLQADMRALNTGRRYSLCLIPFFAFHHLLKVEDQKAALSSIRSHLLPGGRLIFNVFNPDLSRPQGIQRLDKVVEARGQTVMRYSVQWFDRAAKITYGWLIYEFFRPGGVVHRRVTPFKLRYFFRVDIMRLLRATSFTAEHVFGGYDRKPFTRKSPMMIFDATPRRLSQRRPRPAQAGDESFTGTRF